MKPFMRAQLERSVQRLSELDFLLSREDIMQDMTQFMALSREHAEVVALVTPYQKWQQLHADMAAAHAMLQDKDSAGQAMAQEEINSAEPAIVAIEAQLQRMLLPKDPDDTRNAFLEIRAVCWRPVAHVHPFLRQPKLACRGDQRVAQRVGWL